MLVVGLLGVACSIEGHVGGDREDACYPQTEFECHDGDCIPRSYRCDGVEDCERGEDEISCDPPGCRSSEVACDDGPCISITYVCDGYLDCHGGEDELGCSPGGLCTDTCLDAADGYCDDGGAGADFSLCAYGTDCTDCGWRTPACSSSEVACGDGTCIAMTWVCDGYVDCYGGEDELGCGGLCTDSCRWAGDGVCDDGGSGSSYDACGYGTDCTDCGVRN
ncbi:MAG: LDL receptor domain-containing protein [Polyangiaceae bacterium]|nr:LDL receptor domain-containing protein [Polyangiaceae bacterium]